MHCQNTMDPHLFHCGVIHAAPSPTQKCCPADMVQWLGASISGVPFLLGPTGALNGLRDAHTAASPPRGDFPTDSH